MWQNSTLDGLDEALADLQKAIENLPEGPKKKQLTAQFYRLQKVRTDLKKSPRSSRRIFIFILLGLIVLVAAIGINLIFSERKSFGKP